MFPSIERFCPSLRAWERWDMSQTVDMFKETPGRGHLYRSETTKTPATGGRVAKRSPVA